MSESTNVRPTQWLARVAAAGCLAFSLVGALAGCGGPEPQTPTVAPSTGAPGGSSMEDYKKHMQGVTKAPPGAPGGGAGAAGGTAPAPDKK